MSFRQSNKLTWVTIGRQDDLDHVIQKSLQISEPCRQIRRLADSADDRVVEVEGLPEESLESTVPDGNSFFATAFHAVQSEASLQPFEF